MGLTLTASLRNFGPVGKDGGDRRLNVLFSRSRYEMVLCANFASHLITSDNKALQMLKSMLELSVESPSLTLVNRQDLLKMYASLLNPSAIERCRIMVRKAIQSTLPFKMSKPNN